MFIYDLNPVAFSIFGLEVRYYGLIYAFALLFFYYYLSFLCSKRKIQNFKKEDVDNFLIGLILSALLGARIFEVFFYDFSYYIANPQRVFMIWQGGLSFYGGLLFGMIWIYYFGKYKKIHFLEITDNMAIPFAFFLSLGRIANLLNGELRGIQTTSSIGIIYPGENFARLPTQIFESIKNMLIALILFVHTMQKKKLKKNLRSGEISALFLIFYGSFRFLLEFYKEGDAIFLGLNTGHIFSIISICIGISLIYYIRKNTSMKV